MVWNTETVASANTQVKQTSITGDIRTGTLLSHISFRDIIRKVFCHLHVPEDLTIRKPTSGTDGHSGPISTFADLETMNVTLQALTLEYAWTRMTAPISVKCMIYKDLRSNNRLNDQFIQLKLQFHSKGSETSHGHDFKIPEQDPKANR